MNDIDACNPATPRFVEPSAESIGSFARTACRNLAQTLDKQYADPEVIRGLEEFLRIIAGMGTEALNNRSAPQVARNDN